MAARFCRFISGAGEQCQSLAQLLGGQQEFCTTHHRSALQRNSPYKARATAYLTDEARLAAQAAYDKVLGDALAEAEAVAAEATSKLVAIEIPLKERVRIKISGGPSSFLDDTTARLLCAPYGRTTRVAICCDKDGKRNGVVFVTFVTHAEAAEAQRHLDGFSYNGGALKTEWITSVMPPRVLASPLYVLENIPSVRAAKRHLQEAERAARERADPGVLAAEAAEYAAERAEWEAERAEERQWAREEDEHRKAEAAEAERQHKNAMYRKAQMRRFEDERYFGNW